MIKINQAGYRILFSVTDLVVSETSLIQNTALNTHLLKINQSIHLSRYPLSIFKLNKSTDSSNNSSKLKEKKHGYSEEDNKFLIELVRLNGYKPETFKTASKKLGKPHYPNIRRHYDEYIKRKLSASDSSVTEDRTEIEIGNRAESSYIKDDSKSLTNLPNDLKEESKNEENEIKTIEYYSKYADELKLIDHIFNLKQIQARNISSMRNVNENDFELIAEQFNESTGDLHDHWMNVIIPFFEPHMKMLSRSDDFRNDVELVIEKRFEKSPRVVGYTDKEDSFIAEQVEIHGDSPETWVKITNELGKNYPHLVKSHYQNYIAQTPNVSGPFSSEEDDLIVSYISQFGRNKSSFKRVTLILGRGSASSVESRYNRLVSENEYETKSNLKVWGIEEDTKLIAELFKLKDFQINDHSQFGNVKPSELRDIAIKLERSTSSCYGRWMNEIVPVLKTHINKSPKTSDWKRDVLVYIVENNIQNKKELDFESIIRTIAPGQTIKSLLIYINNARRQTIDGVLKTSNLPLCELASKILNEKSPKNPLFNDNRARKEHKRLERSEHIIQCYESLF